MLSMCGTLTTPQQLANSSRWWEILNQVGPSLGYFVRPSKTWLLTKDEHLARAKSAALFQGSEVNITTQGGPYIFGAPLGSTKFVEGFISSKVNHWIGVVDSLSGIATSQPHAALAAYTSTALSTNSHSSAGLYPQHRATTTPPRGVHSSQVYPLSLWSNSTK